jgi:hypothetical protein
MTGIFPVSGAGVLMPGSTSGGHTAALVEHLA